MNLSKSETFNLKYFPSSSDALFGLDWLESPIKIKCSVHSVSAVTMLASNTFAASSTTKNISNHCMRIYFVGIISDMIYLRSSVLHRWYWWVAYSYVWPHHLLSFRWSWHVVLPRYQVIRRRVTIRFYRKTSKHPRETVQDRCLSDRQSILVEGMHSPATPALCAIQHMFSQSLTIGSIHSIVEIEKICFLFVTWMALDDNQLLRQCGTKRLVLRFVQTKIVMVMPGIFVQYLHGEWLGHRIRSPQAVRKSIYRIPGYVRWRRNVSIYSDDVLCQWEIFILEFLEHLQIIAIRLRTTKNWKWIS